MAQEKAIDRYKAKNIKAYKFELNRKTDAKIMEKLDAEPNKQGLIKRLLYNHYGEK